MKIAHARDWVVLIAMILWLNIAVSYVSISILDASLPVAIMICLMISMPFGLTGGTIVARRRLAR